MEKAGLQSFPWKSEAFLPADAFSISEVHLRIGNKKQINCGAIVLYLWDIDAPIWLNNSTVAEYLD